MRHIKRRNLINEAKRNSTNQTVEWRDCGTDDRGIGTPLPTGIRNTLFVQSVLFFSEGYLATYSMGRPNCCSYTQEQSRKESGAWCRCYCFRSQG